MSKKEYKKKQRRGFMGTERDRERDRERGEEGKVRERGKGTCRGEN